jgi:hypothetical protein
MWEREVSNLKIEMNGEMGRLGARLGVREKDDERLEGN